MILQRLIITFKPEGVEIRTLYCSKDGPNLGTKSRTKEALELSRTGLEQALQALEDSADCVGTSGFTTRAVVLLAAASPETAKLVKGA